MPLKDKLARKEYCRIYHLEHLEKIRARKREYRKTDRHKELKMAGWRRYKMRHPDEVRARIKAWGKRNPDKRKAIFARYRKAHPERVRETHYKYILRTRFGISMQDYATLITKQDGKCAICKDTFPDGKRPHLDHDHKSNKVRGLLCKRCNNALGQFRDSPAILQAAREYLEAASAN